MKTLDAAVKHNVSYCIPTWLRDVQIESAIARPIPRIQPMQGLRDEPIALVCFGPSLEDTWEQVRGFRYVMSCSGAHKFLVERGITPTWHVEVDPRAHKVGLLGDPTATTEYLVASTCHPDYFDHLEKHGAHVRLWHIFDSSEDALRTLPREEWALTGGSSVGLRTMTLARFFGFRDLHIFGMDGCARGSASHAMVHPHNPKTFAACEYEGVTYYTTVSMLEVAKGTFHELNQMPDVRATFYGDGLVQAMAKQYVPAPIEKEKTIIGCVKPDLISPEYRAMNEQLHKNSQWYGVGGWRYAPTAIKLAGVLKTKDILDYGAGKRRLAHAIPWNIAEYDPAVPEIAASPKPADLVICTDTLEHIEPDKLDLVLDDLRRVTLQMGYFVIFTQPSTKFLPDGRNAHLIQQDRTWWEKRLVKFFKVVRVWETGPTIHVLVTPAVRPGKQTLSAKRVEVMA